MTHWTQETWSNTQQWAPDGQHMGGGKAPTALPTSASPSHSPSWLDAHLPFPNTAVLTLHSPQLLQTVLFLTSTPSWSACLLWGYWWEATEEPDGGTKLY